MEMDCRTFYKILISHVAALKAPKAKPRTVWRDATQEDIDKLFAN